MNASIDIVTTFALAKSEDGHKHFTGTLDLAALKKTKQREIEVILIPLSSLPKAILGLQPKSAPKDGLVMFAATASSDGHNAKPDKKRD